MWSIVTVWLCHPRFQVWAAVPTGAPCSNLAGSVLKLESCGLREQVQGTEALPWLRLPTPGPRHPADPTSSALPGSGVQPTVATPGRAVLLHRAVAAGGRTGEHVQCPGAFIPTVILHLSINSCDRYCLAFALRTRSHFFTLMSRMNISELDREFKVRYVVDMLWICCVDML